MEDFLLTTKSKFERKMEFQVRFQHLFHCDDGNPCFAVKVQLSENSGHSLIFQMNLSDLGNRLISMSTKIHK